MNKWKNKTEPIRDMDRKAKKKLKGGKLRVRGKHRMKIRKDPSEIGPFRYSDFI